MTGRHAIIGLQQATRSRNHGQLARRLNLDDATVYRLYTEQVHDMRVSTMLRTVKLSGVPLDQLLAWWTLPSGAIMPAVEVIGWPPAKVEA